MNPDFRIMNSMTKYPSIETYHEMEKGKLTGELTEQGRLVCGWSDISVTEKINGTNARTIFCSSLYQCGFHDWLLGSRDDLVMARGDRIPNPVEGIAENLKEQAETLFKIFSDVPMAKLPYKIQQAKNNLGLSFLVIGIYIIVVYEELYGGKVGGDAKNYARDGSIGHRVFDVRVMTWDEYRAVLTMPIEQIAAKRDRGTLPGRWLADEERFAFCMDLGLEMVPLLEAPPLPASIEGAYAWMKEVVGERTHAAIGNNEPGRPEGVVVRLPDHSVIVKLRFQDYERALGIR